MAEKSELRIVAGTLRGRKVTCLVHEGLRPTPQFVREALFSILGNAVPGRVFYDVFAGTGVVGMEAVSRGATRASLIEKDPRQANDIGRYIDRFGIADRCQVLRTDGYRWAERWIATTGGPVNVFLSPPFPDLQPVKVAAFLQLIGTILNKAPDASVVAVQAEAGFPLDDLPGGTDGWDIRSYGRNLLLFRVKGDDVATEVTAEDKAGSPDTGES